jgi:hypothetical protein
MVRRAERMVRGRRRVVRVVGRERSILRGVEMGFAIVE